MARRSLLITSGFFSLFLTLITLAVLAGETPSVPPALSKRAVICKPGEAQPPEKEEQPHPLCGKGTRWIENTRQCICKPNFDEAGQDVLGRSECKPHHKEVDFSGYIADLQKRIKDNWSPPVRYRYDRVALFFKILKDGQLVKACISEAAHDQKANEMAYQALLKSAPFAPLPSDFKGTDIDVQFVLEYKLLPGARTPRPGFDIRFMGVGVGLYTR